MCEHLKGQKKAVWYINVLFVTALPAWLGTGLAQTHRLNIFPFIYILIFLSSTFLYLLSKLDISTPLECFLAPAVRRKDPLRTHGTIEFFIHLIYLATDTYHFICKTLAKIYQVT